jgi:hypothetical protein
MKKDSNVAEALHFLKRPEDTSTLPVLNDVLIASADASGRTLWLAWDERRVPVLTDEVALSGEPRLPRWLRRRI